MKKIFLLALISIFYSCTEEKITIKEVEKDFSWQSLPQFEYGYGYVLNGYATDDFCFFMSNRDIYSFVKEGESHPYSIFGSIQMINSYLGVENSTQLKYPISENLIITSSNMGKDFVAIRPIHKPSETYGSTKSYIDINLKTLDKNYLYAATKGRKIGFEHLLNSKNQALLFYKVKPNHLKALLVDVNVEQSGTSFTASIDKTKNLSFENDYDQEHLYSYNVGDNFLVCPTYEHSYLVTPNGEVQFAANKCFNKLYKYEDYYIAYDFRSGGGYISKDKGLSWEQKFEVHSTLSLLNYTTIDNKLIAFYNNQIFELEWADDFSSVDYRILDDYGLEGKEITSIVEFDDLVYISTLSGVYYRKLEDFFTLKELKEEDQ